MALYSWFIERECTVSSDLQKTMESEHKNLTNCAMWPIAKTRRYTVVIKSRKTEKKSPNGAEKHSYC